MNNVCHAVKVEYVEQLSCCGLDHGKVNPLEIAPVLIENCLLLWDEHIGNGWVKGYLPLSDWKFVGDLSIPANLDDTMH